ncbi:anti-sigma factor family protein [Micromonospora endophytica]|uniref:RNA polymerase subunit sigma n=1 Tax=Micromonospora endophytica TaxID=515350 RepID=A0A2W2CJP9_9ACTN|nr:zf-HC2 domain-containing protein [Micromonospora endophytica]PZF98130.1 RNA polymerase subunit sigma [Micromonospora endophytica]RIW42441.1 RNA polymerase subunit sigma [Micromonospora endophytica]BCJ57702.1 RNA polymerase subunit sigma [Micromonospora endophytica]
MSRVDHMDVAAYALGVLDEQDMERFEEHLATCWACASELESMVPVVGLLSDIDAESMTALEQTQSNPILLDRTLVAMRTHRRRARVRQILATAAAVVVFGGLTGIGFASLTPETPGPNLGAGPTTNSSLTPPNPGSGDPGGPGFGGNVQEGERVDGTDSNTGVEGTFFLDSRDFGTMVAFTLSRLPGPRECHLAVVRKNGSTEIISSWSVPPGGYGTTSNPTPLTLYASTSTKLDDVKHFRVEQVNDKGTASALLTIPAP